MKITEDNLKEAIEKCLSNALDLIDDASLLKKNNRKERAYTLFQLAIEEVGKAIRIFVYLLFDNLSDEKTKKIFLKDFRDHQEKTRKSIAMDYYFLLIGKDHIDDKLKFLEASAYELKNISKLNDLKNYSLYTSIHNNQFKTPKELISDSNLDSIEFRALTRYRVAKSYLQFQLPHLETLKNYFSTNPITLSEDELIKNFWEYIQ